MDEKFVLRHDEKGTIVLTIKIGECDVVFDDIKETDVLSVIMGASVVLRVDENGIFVPKLEVGGTDELGIEVVSSAVLGIGVSDTVVLGIGDSAVFRVVVGIIDETGLCVLGTEAG